MRCGGKIPAVLYGGSGEPQAVTVNTKQVAGILRSESGHNTIFTVKLNGSEHKAILKDWQVAPRKGYLCTVVFLESLLTFPCAVKWPFQPSASPQASRSKVASSEW